MEFTGYAEGQAWVAKRARDYPTKAEFMASQEYKDAFPAIRAAWDREQAQRADVVLAAMAEEGIAVGDRVSYVLAGWLWDSGRVIKGRIVTRHSMPAVRLDEKEMTSSGWRRYVQWNTGWRKAD